MVFPPYLEKSIDPGVGYRVYIYSGFDEEELKMQRRALRNAGEKTDEHSRMLKIGEVSKLSGLGIEALRFYEKSGLLDKPARTNSGYRMYPSSALERIEFIKRAQVLCFSLDEIKRVIDDARSGQSPCDEVREIVHRRV